MKSRDETPGDNIISAPSYQADLESTVASDKAFCTATDARFNTLISILKKKANELSYAIRKLAKVP